MIDHGHDPHSQIYPEDFFALVVKVNGGSKLASECFQTQVRSMYGMAGVFTFSFGSWMGVC